MGKVEQAMTHLYLNWWAAPPLPSVPTVTHPKNICCLVAKSSICLKTAILLLPYTSEHGMKPCKASSGPGFLKPSLPGQSSLTKHLLFKRKLSCSLVHTGLGELRGAIFSAELQWELVVWL